MWGHACVLLHGGRHRAPAWSYNWLCMGGHHSCPRPKPTLLHVSVQIAVRTVRRSARRCVPIGISLGATTAPPASAPATEE